MKVFYASAARLSSLKIVLGMGRRFFQNAWWLANMALKGQGATVRYETLSFEARGYAGRETLLQILVERIQLVR